MKKLLDAVLGSKTGAGEQSWIYPILVRKLFAVRAANVGMSAVGAAAVALTASAQAGDPALALLSLSAAGGVAGAAVFLHRMKPTRDTAPDDARRLERQLAISVALPHLLIGLATARAIISAEDALVHLLMFSVAMAAMISTLRNYPRPRIVSMQLTLLLSPIVLAMIVRGEAAYWLLAAGSCLIATTTTAISRSLYASLETELLADDTLRTQHLRFEAALDNMAQGLAMFGAGGELVVFNSRYLAMYGLSGDIVKPGMPLSALLEHSIAMGNHGDTSAEELAEFLGRRFQAGSAEVFYNPLGNGRTIAVAYEPMAGGGWVTTHEDITERQAAEAKIAYLARHDSLTGLPNRVVFRDELDETVSSDREDAAVMCLDLDRFKAVNDTLGHPVGDQLLKEAAARLRSVIRETDVVARLGGDEFAIIQKGAPQPTSATLLADRVIEVLCQPYEIDGHQISVGCSIGISVASVDGREPDQLMRSADLALYRAKSDGRGQHRFFAADMDERMQARRKLELDLRRALIAGEFELAYQPLVTVETGAVAGFEALLRWRHPERGIVLPGEFIPLAEEIGLIIPLGDWILREACGTAASWPNNVRVAVNLSPVQFRSGNLFTSVVMALSAAGLQPHRLELEITEGVLLADTEGTMEVLHKLRDLGVRIAMDDFGTGYSSLSYLRSFPFDKIKIDRSFISDIQSDPEALAIVKAVTNLGRSLGMSTTAEGIETEEQLAQLRADGCSEVQGYLLGRPMSANAASGVLLSQTSAADAA